MRSNGSTLKGDRMTNRQPDELLEIEHESPAGMPSPDDIAEQCRQIRAGWTPEEFERRAAGFGRQAWKVPGSQKTATLWQGRQARPDAGTAEW